MKNLRLAAALAVLTLAGCSNGVDEAQEAAARQAEADAQAQAREAELLSIKQNCISNAVNNSILSSLTGSAYLASFEQQNLDGCPVDFIEKFVALGVSVRRYASTVTDLSRHAGNRDAAVAGGIWVTIRDSYQGRTSNDSPMTDWAMQNSDLRQREAVLRTETEDYLAAMKVVMAHYGVAVQPAPPVDAAAPADNADDGYSAATK